MADLDDLHRALDPLLAFLRTYDATDGPAALEAAFPFDGPQVQGLRALVREGVDSGWLAPRENEGIRFGRVRKAENQQDIGVECVHMDKPGPGHTHPRGEIDLCFAVEGTPTFDGEPEGWTVYPEGSWHVPSVEGGVMDILYFLPGGSIRFEPDPAG